MSAKRRGKLKDSVKAVPEVVVIGFGRRLGAAALDGVIVFFIAFLVAFVVGFVGLLVEIFSPDRPLRIDLIVTWCVLIVSVLYFVAYWATTGQTLGKVVLGIRIAGANGHHPTWGRAIVRYFGYIISGALLSLGFIWIALDSHRQGWHDKMAGTYVVFLEDKFAEPKGVRFVPSDPDQSWAWIALWIAVALLVPAALFASLWLLGPVMNRIVGGFIQGLVQ